MQSLLRISADMGAAEAIKIATLSTPKKASSPLFALVQLSHDKTGFTGTCYLSDFSHRMLGQTTELVNL